MRFSIRDLMFLTALVAVAVACLVDRWNVAAKIEDRKASLEQKAYETDMRNLKAHQEELKKTRQ